MVCHIMWLEKNYRIVYKVSGRVMNDCIKIFLKKRLSVRTEFITPVFREPLETTINDLVPVDFMSQL